MLYLQGMHIVEFCEQTEYVLQRIFHISKYYDTPLSLWPLNYVHVRILLTSDSKR